MTAPAPRLDTVDLVRALRAAPISDGQRVPSRYGPRVWFNHVLSPHTHTTWGNGTTPVPCGPLPAPSPHPGQPGAGVRVGVLDSGLEDHGWFGGRCTAVGGLALADVAERVGDVDGDEIPDYDAGHGSFVAGTVLQAAPGAEIVVARMKDPTGCVSDWDIHGQLWTLLYGPPPVDVLNLSFGGPTDDNLPLPGLCGVLTHALQLNPGS